jgi:xanthine dehydrogenase accessory factor
MGAFLEPLDDAAGRWLRPVTQAAAEPRPVALVTAVEGASAGMRVLVRDDAVVGDLGDPDRTAEAVAVGRRVLEREGTELAAVRGGRVYAEVFGPAPALVIVGAGHVGKALAALGKLLGVAVTVIDDREEYACRERFPEVDRVIAGPVGETVGREVATAATAVVVAMRNQDLDYEATAAALRSPARYVGLIGARRKAILIAERLLADRLPADRVRALRSPIGLDIGARTPEEIAVSILGEWIMLRQGGSGAPLRLADELLAKARERADRGALAAGPEGSAG